MTTAGDKKAPGRGLLGVWLLATLLMLCLPEYPVLGHKLPFESNPIPECVDVGGLPIETKKFLPQNQGARVTKLERFEIGDSLGGTFRVNADNFQSHMGERDVSLGNSVRFLLKADAVPALLQNCRALSIVSQNILEARTIHFGIVHGERIVVHTSGLEDAFDGVGFEDRVKVRAFGSHDRFGLCFGSCRGVLGRLNSLFGVSQAFADEAQLHEEQDGLCSTDKDHRECQDRNGLLPPLYFLFVALAAFVGAGGALLLCWCSGMLR